MRKVAIAPKSELSAEQLREASTRILDIAHRDDVGPFNFWNHPGYEPKYLAAFDLDSGVFVGTVYGRIAIPSYFEAAWWIDSLRRKEGYGYSVMDTLAEYLKRHRVTTLGTIHFRGEFDAASRKLAKRLACRMK